MYFYKTKELLFVAPAHYWFRVMGGGSGPTKGGIVLKNFSIKLNDKKSTKSYPQVGLGVILCMVYNVYQVGKSGKSVDK